MDFLYFFGSVKITTSPYKSVNYIYRYSSRRSVTITGLVFFFVNLFCSNVFDPRQMRVSVQGSGIYRNRERGHR